MYEFYITSFVTLFLIVDPIALTPLFIALTQGMTNPQRRGVALRALIIAFVILSAFAIVGERLLEFIGIGMPAFRIAGGLLVFLIAVEMLFERRSVRREKQSEDADRPDPSVFPLATPMLAGPGAMAAMILLAGQVEQEFNAILTSILSLLSVMVLSFVMFSFSGAFERLLGHTGINVVTRLLGMLLAALAVQFVVDGVFSLIPQS